MNFVNNFRDTKRGFTELVIVVDRDDPDYEGYEGILRWNEVPMITAPETARGMCGALNYAFEDMSGHLGEYVGFMGDDHFPRTEGWDLDYITELEAIGGIGFVYGDDLYQHQTIPTQVAFSTAIAETLGWMVPPQFHHLFVDVVWRDLGLGIERLSYLPNTIVEHMHPLAGKVRSDKNYAIVNNSVIARHDQEAYDEYVKNDLAADVLKLKALIQ